ncbi:bile acid:sodium symporter [soil metagenome]
MLFHQAIARHWFLLGLAAATGLAFLLPEVGARGGPLRPEITTRAGVAAIFFMQGLALAPAALRVGALQWRLHLATQLFIFAGFPFVVIALDAAGGHLLPPDLRLGFIFLAILPTTISGCVVFTAAGGGNVSGALFNAVLANMAGVVLTPLWATLLLSARGEAPDPGPMIVELSLLLLVPIALGQAARPLLRYFRDPHPRLFSNLSSLIILYIVFIAFNDSARSGAFGETGVRGLGIIVIICIGLFVAATAAAGVTAQRLHFPAADRIALLFCAPHKTLAAGAPMAQVLFAGHPGLGLILLPLIVYHAVQLLGGAALIERLPREEAVGQLA